MDAIEDEPSGSKPSLNLQMRHPSLRLSHEHRLRSSSPMSQPRDRMASPSASASTTQSPDLRKSASRSTMTTEGIWDQSMNRKRWSAWTTDTDPTELSSSQLNIEFDTMLKPVPGSAPESSYAAASRSDQGNSMGYSIDEGSEYNDMSQAMGIEDSSEGWTRREAGPREHWARSSRSPSPVPPSPTSEAALDAALSSTMLALTTANSLLLSTMASRRDLAQMRALQNEMDSSLNRREQDLRRKVDENNRTIAWMEQACKRLDDLLEGRQPEKMATDEDELNELAEIVNQQEALRPSLTSNASIRSNDLGSARGKLFVSASNAVPSVSRIVSQERGLTSPNLDRPRGDDENESVGSSAAQRLASVLQQSGPRTAASDIGSAEAAPAKSANAAQLKQTATQLPRRLQGAQSSVASPSAIQATLPAMQAATSKDAKSKTASALLSATLRSEVARDESSPKAAPKAMANGERKSVEAVEEAVGRSAASHSVATTTSPRIDMMHHRTPSALKVAQDTQGSGSSLTNAAHSWRGEADAGTEDHLARLANGADGVPRARRKGALEALRQLNSGSHAERTQAPALSSSPGSTGRGDRAGAGWGGTIASWIGLQNEGQNAKAGIASTETQPRSESDKDQGAKTAMAERGSPLMSKAE